MYFIEKILRIFYPKQKHTNNYKLQEIEHCNHIFMPIDSTREYLSCTKCGKLIKNDANYDICE